MVAVELMGTVKLSSMPKGKASKRAPTKAEIQATKGGRLKSRPIPPATKIKVIEPIKVFWVLGILKGTKGFK